MPSITTFGFSPEQEASVRMLITEVAQEATDFFGYKEDFSILVYQAWTYYGVNSTGANSYKDEVLEIRLDISDDEAEVKQRAKLTICHELAHIIRYHQGVFGKRIIDALVLEGISAVIEEELDEQPFYVGEILGEDEHISAAIKKLYETEFDYNEWFNGTGDLPAWFGYRFGYLIVKEFLEKNPTEYSNLVLLKSDEVVAGTKYL